MQADIKVWQFHLRKLWNSRQKGLPWIQHRSLQILSLKQNNISQWILMSIASNTVKAHIRIMCKDHLLTSRKIHQLALIKWRKRLKSETIKKRACNKMGCSFEKLYTSSSLNQVKCNVMGQRATWEKEMWRIVTVMIIHLETIVPRLIDRVRL